MIEKILSIRMTRALVLCLSIGLVGCSDAAESANTATSSLSEEVAPYRTYLFNLLINKRSLVDGKNHYQKEFDQSFDAMLKTSNLVKAAHSSIPIKKRLLSGPQPEPKIVLAGSDGREYVYYEACQAHACNVTKLAVLYCPEAKKMLARLNLDGKIEYLGNPTPAEKAVLDQPKSTL